MLKIERGGGLHDNLHGKISSCSSIEKVEGLLWVMLIDRSCLTQIFLLQLFNYHIQILMGADK